MGEFGGLEVKYAGDVAGMEVDRVWGARTLTAAAPPIARSAYSRYRGGVADEPGFDCRSRSARLGAASDGIALRHYPIAADQRVLQQSVKS